MTIQCCLAVSAFHPSIENDIERKPAFLRHDISLGMHSILDVWCGLHASRATHARDGVTKTSNSVVLRSLILHFEFFKLTSPHQVIKAWHNVCGVTEIHPEICLPLWSVIRKGFLVISVFTESAGRLANRDLKIPWL